MDWLIDLLPSGAAVGNALWLLVTFLLLLLVVPLAALGLPGKLAGFALVREHTWLEGAPSLCGGWGPALRSRRPEKWSSMCLVLPPPRRGRWEAWHVGGCHRLSGRRRGGTVRPPTGDRGHFGGHARGVHWGLCWRDVLRGTQQGKRLRPAVWAAGGRLWRACSPKLCPAASWPCWWPWIL